MACLGLVLGLVQADVGRAADPSLVGWWRFDETSGTVAADSSAYGNHGAVRGTPRWVAGQIDGALYLAGGQQYVDLPIGPVMDSLTDCTIALWVNWTGYSLVDDWQRIFDFGSGTAVNMFLTPSVAAGGPMRFAIKTAPIGSEDQITAAAFLDAGWHHVAVTINSANTTIAVFVDGEVAAASATVRNKLSDLGPTTNNWLGRSQYDDPYFRGYLDDLYIFNRVLSPSELQALAAGGLGSGLAAKPVPADREAEVLRDVMLGWTPGVFASTHNVYFGDTFEAVSKAGAGSPLLVGPGLVAAAYDAGRLEFSRTYYWRVDEVNAPPDNTVFKGDVWTFTVEPYAYPIGGESITATASSQSAGWGPEKTIDGSGLDAQDTHSVMLDDMWLTAEGSSLPAWIQYTFDRPRRLDQMRVWNFNGESFLAILGIKDVVVEHSMDGLDWTPLSGVAAFPMAPGTAGYASDITVDLGGVAAEAVRIQAQSNYAGGGYDQCGLSEVRLMAVPMSARNPSPESGAEGIDPRGVLMWRPGREAGHHQVYLDASEQAVREGTAPVHATHEIRLAMLELDLRLGQTHYWRVDEVNEAAVPSVWTGETWAFTVAQTLVVDDFESYGNSSPHRPFQTWIDGVGYSDPTPGNPGNHTGAAVGHDIWSPGSEHLGGTLMETTIVRSGLQSLPLYYDNSGAGGGLTYSQMDRAFTPAEDWTRFGIRTLILYFRGVQGNSGQLYVQINNTKILYPGNAADIATEAWTAWEIDLASSGASLGGVSTLSIGIQGSGARGLLYIDELGLK
ncbi:MAG: discoidin domain-containing protein [Phycisphaerae bacterium]|nr:discoidin domain-containing protein [Phycisphaerae bacterium]